MKSLNYMKLFTLVFLLQALVACEMFTDLTKQKSVSERVQDVKVLIIAANKSIGNDVEAGFITPDVAQYRLDHVRDFTEKLKAVEAIIGTGDMKMADRQLVIIEASMLSLRDYVNKKAKEQ